MVDQHFPNKWPFVGIPHGPHCIVDCPIESNKVSLDTIILQKGTLSVPTFLSPHVSQFPRFHMSGQTTWQITYESLLGTMLRLRNSCLWICSVTNKQTWGTPDSDYISNSQERKSHTENKRKKKMGWPPPFTSPKTAYRANPDIFFLVVELLTFVFCSCFLLFFLFLWISHMLTWCVLIICFEECLQTQRTGV